MASENQPLTKSYEEEVVAKARQYLRSNPGPSEGGSNVSLHMLLDNIIDPVPWIPNTQEMLNEANAELDYRLSCMEKADEYVERMGLIKPFDQSCAEFLAEDYTREHGDETQWTTINRLFWKEYAWKLFRKPKRGQGHQFGKGENYVIAAIKCTIKEEKMTLEECIQALDKFIQDTKRERGVGKGKGANRDVSSKVKASTAEG